MLLAISKVAIPVSAFFLIDPAACTRALLLLASIYHVTALPDYRRRSGRTMSCLDSSSVSFHIVFAATSEAHAVY